MDSSVVEKALLSDMPHMDEAGLDLFDKSLQGTADYLEYGCGGSTTYAIRQGVKRLVAVDSSSEWIASVSDRLLLLGQELIDLDAEINLEHCDIGPVGSWGTPINQAMIRNFHAYAVRPWAVARDRGIDPGLVLVDGRFRVACFLYSLACASPGTVILFDDYANRPHYHVVEEFCARSGLAGRMGLFVVVEKPEMSRLMAAFAKYSINFD